MFDCKIIQLYVNEMETFVVYILSILFWFQFNIFKTIKWSITQPLNKSYLYKKSLFFGSITFEQINCCCVI